jgi:hypothetical protein
MWTFSRRPTVFATLVAQVHAFAHLNRSSEFFARDVGAGGGYLEIVGTTMTSSASPPITSASDGSDEGWISVNGPPPTATEIDGVNFILVSAVGPGITPSPTNPSTVTFSGIPGIEEPQVLVAEAINKIATSQPAQSAHSPQLSSDALDSIQQWLGAHNSARNIYGNVPALVWDDTLTLTAQYNAANCDAQHT